MLNDPKTRKAQIRVLVADSSRIHTHLLAEALKRAPSLQPAPAGSLSH